MNTVIHTPEQNGLVAQLNACVREHGSSSAGIRSNFIGVVEMRVEPNRMIFPDHRAEFWSDSLGEYYRSARADADDFNVFNGTQA